MRYALGQRRASCQIGSEIGAVGITCLVRGHVLGGRPLPPRRCDAAAAVVGPLRAHDAIKT